jgi:hypothetical protein
VGLRSTRVGLELVGRFVEKLAEAALRGPLKYQRWFGGLVFNVCKKHGVHGQLPNLGRAIQALAGHYDFRVREGAQGFKGQFQERADYKEVDYGDYY